MEHLYKVMNSEIDRLKGQSRYGLFWEFYKFRLASILYSFYVSFSQWWYGDNVNEADLNVSF
jgi:hypothetical protein